MSTWNLDDFYDAVIIGGGPSGLSSAIYLARAKYKCLVIEKQKFGGQITITQEVVNYPGVYHTSGEALTKEMIRQAEGFGAQFLMADVEGFEKSDAFYEIKTSKGTIKTLGVVIAAGASPRVVGFEGEQEFKGRGVAYCATCDGEFFTGRDIMVLGSGFAACEEALFLTRFAKSIKMMMITDDFTCTGNVVDEVKAHEKIQVFYETGLSKVSGNTFVQKAEFVKGEFKEGRFVPGDEIFGYEDEAGLGVFVFAGYVPASKPFKHLVETNPQGYIVTDQNKKTNLDGVYAAGDICIKTLRQVVTAVSDGAISATCLEKFLAEQYEKNNIPARPVKEVKKPNAQSKEAKSDEQSDDKFISTQMRNDLVPVFERFTSSVLLKYAVDESALSKEVLNFVNEINETTDRIKVEKQNDENVEIPAIEICEESGKSKNVYFHGVPGGHEFNSFVIGLYNAAGPGQAIEPQSVSRIKALRKQLNIKLAVTLSCTNCPELVMAVQRIAMLSENIRLDIYDLSKFEELKNKFNIMSVPCMIVDDNEVHFGKKNIEEVLDILEKI